MQVSHLLVNVFGPMLRRDCCGGSKCARVFDALPLKGLRCNGGRVMLIHRRTVFGGFLSEEKRREIAEKKAKAKAELKADMERGYFGDLKEVTDMQKQGKKNWAITSSELISKEKAERLTALECKSIETGDTEDLVRELKRHHCTLVLLAFRDYGKNMLPDYADAFMKVMKIKSRILQISVVESSILKAFGFMFENGIRKQTPESYLKNQYIYYGDVEKIKSQFGIGNAMLGYVYLVDGKGRIRWTAKGPSVPEELENLQKAYISLKSEF
eukprot:Nk52_evm38s223 gene=Nk52_evmTU38s223